MSKAFGFRAGARRGAISRVLAAMIGAVLIASLAVAGSAWATTGYGFAGAFGGAGSDPGQFAPGGPAGVAVDQTSGDVFGADPGHTLGDGTTPDPRIERFDASGAFQDAFSIDGTAYVSLGPLAVDPASGALYVSSAAPDTSGAVLKYSASGAFQYALDVGSSGLTIGYDASIAVDPTDGTVYTLATDSSFTNVVAAFSGATGAFLQSFAVPEVSCPNALAVDPSHNVYVTDRYCAPIVARYTAAGTFDTTIDDGSHGSPAGIAIDPTSGEAFVAESGPTGLRIVSYAGATRGPAFDASAAVDVTQLAVEHSSGTVYAVGGAGTIARFVRFDGPTVTTDPASPVTGTSATLNGTIDPGGVPATYHFEYGLDTDYGTSTPGTSAGSGSGAVPAPAVLSGLTPNQTYHYRVVGTNAGGSIFGDDRSFSTDAIAPTIVGAPFSTSMTLTSARVHGVVNPNHTQTSWHVDYGVDTTYGSSTSPDGDAGAGTADVAVGVVIDGLQPATTYHYRVTADNGAGAVQHGPDGTFRTAIAAPASATGVTTTHATLVGTIDPRGVATTYHFEYGPSPAYGRRTPEADGGSGSGENAVTALVGELEPSTTYHVRVVATSGAETWSGADGTFTTPPLPTNTVGAVTGVGTTTATLNGTVDTHGAAGTYQFEVSSSDSAYTLVSPARPLSSASGVRSVSEAVSGLPAGERFTVRLMSNSVDGTGYSDPVTFATAPPPRTFPAPPPLSAIGTYGCTVPRLDAYNKKPHPGDVIAITGNDLGVGGTVSLGSASPTPADWTSTSFSVTVPDVASGTLPLTINCGNVSNTVAVAIFHEPSNAFSITRSSVSGSTATLSVKVPGPGKIETTAPGMIAAKKTVTKAGTAKVAIKLSNAGKKALKKARSKKLTVTIRLKYTPAGGTAASRVKTITFKTGSKR
jgi:hypothetical protein